MSIMKARRLFQASLLLVTTLVLSACGFHLRERASLPPSMQRVHLAVSGGGEFQRHLTRALETSGVTVEDNSGAGIAELRVPVAAFSTDTLSAGGYVRITEYAVHYQVQFDVVGDGWSSRWQRTTRSFIACGDRTIKGRAMSGVQSVDGSFLVSCT